MKRCNVKFHLDNQVNKTLVPPIFSVLRDSKLLAHWKALPSIQQEHLLSQLNKIDLSTLHAQQQLITHTYSSEPSFSFSPFLNYSKKGNSKDEHEGKKAISQGLAGCLVVAGGQGSRLRIDGPKGICPVTSVRHKSLFQLAAEKTLAAGKQAGRQLPLAIMTSPLNHLETLRFFESHSLFGLSPSQLSFFTQGMLPLLDQQGHLILETSDSLAFGPDGNGEALHHFYRSGIWQLWQQSGVRYVNFILIDNPLADPFDSELIGYQKRIQADVVIKCTPRTRSEENVGVIVEREGKAAVIEYTELSHEERAATLPNGSLRHPLANLSLFSFTMEFIQQMASIKLPLHKAWKAIRHLYHPLVEISHFDYARHSQLEALPSERENTSQIGRDDEEDQFAKAAASQNGKFQIESGVNESGNTIQAEKPMAWKFETFIFDILPFSKNTHALAYPREICFAPLKNFSGNDSFDTVAEALQNRDRQILENLTGQPCSITPLELSQDFYYPTAELSKKWRGKSIKKNGYIDADDVSMY